MNKTERSCVKKFIKVLPIQTQNDFNFQETEQSFTRHEIVHIPKSSKFQTIKTCNLFNSKNTVNQLMFFTPKQDTTLIQISYLITQRRYIKQDQDKNNLLHLIFSQFNTDIILAQKLSNYLLDNGVNPNKYNIFQWSPLHIALKHNQNEAIIFADKYNAKGPQQRFDFHALGGIQQINLMHIAAIKGNADMLQQLQKQQHVSLFTESLKNLTPKKNASQTQVMLKLLRKLEQNEINKQLNMIQWSVKVRGTVYSENLSEEDVNGLENCVYELKETEKKLDIETFSDDEIQIIPNEQMSSMKQLIQSKTKNQLIQRMFNFPELIRLGQRDKISDILLSNEILQQLMDMSELKESDSVYIFLSIMNLLNQLKQNIKLNINANDLRILLTKLNINYDEKTCKITYDYKMKINKIIQIFYTKKEQNIHDLDLPNLRDIIQRTPSTPQKYPQERDKIILQRKMLSQNLQYDLTNQLFNHNQVLEEIFENMAILIQAQHLNMRSKQLQKTYYSGSRMIYFQYEQFQWQESSQFKQNPPELPCQSARNSRFSEIVYTQKLPITGQKSRNLNSINIKKEILPDKASIIQQFYVGRSQK